MDIVSELVKNIVTTLVSTVTIVVMFFRFLNKERLQHARQISEIIEKTASHVFNNASLEHRVKDLEAAEKALKAVEEELKGYAQRTGKKALKGFGATVTQVTRQGSIDYTKVPALKGLDLESYRKKPSTYWMVKI